jgi:uncharacterized protein (DUF2132 family)
MNDIETILGYLVDEVGWAGLLGNHLKRLSFLFVRNNPRISSILSFDDGCLSLYFLLIMSFFILQC